MRIAYVPELEALAKSMQEYGHELCSVHTRAAQGPAGAAGRALYLCQGEIATGSPASDSFPSLYGPVRTLKGAPIGGSFLLSGKKRGICP